MIAYCSGRLALSFQANQSSSLSDSHLQGMNPVAKLLASKSLALRQSRLAGTGDSGYDRIYGGVELKARIEPRW